MLVLGHNDIARGLVCVLLRACVRVLSLTDILYKILHVKFDLYIRKINEGKLIFEKHSFLPVLFLDKKNKFCGEEKFNLGSYYIHPWRHRRESCPNKILL